MVLDYILNVLVPIFIHIMEVIGVFIILFSALKSFMQYARRYFDFTNDNIKIEFAKGLALALEFKLGAEILKTLTIRTLDEMLILASIVLLRVVLTFVIHWEIESDTKRHHDFIRSKEMTKENLKNHN